MKKVFKILMVLTVSAITVIFPGCKKCLECEYEFVDNHGSHTHDEHVHEKKCGSEKELKEFEEAMQAGAKEHGTTAVCLQAE